ncbi:conjugal transfer protein TrbE [Phenylobacterium sp.]|jgi:type IV secretion system protein VirB4|uniref:conjugal transfer protein TrbE n=1 Tax=Phenylobacterium sp. TaxID=1871053 RepID=UPI002E2F7BDE|nr:conjugal transfer protein TrbE [Phenylobacterium sp.]HEX2562017.1 conjugal transfer protein TrbE [Phenylobacterium sp.]
MRFLDEHRRRPELLADHLPWAALVSPGVVLNKDGSFLAAAAFRGPDLESSTADELMATRARLNNVLKRLGSGWCLHVEARRRPADAYPHSDIDVAAAWLVEAERRASFEAAVEAFETDFFLTLTWLPPADEARRLDRWLFGLAADEGEGARGALERFERETAGLVDLLQEALPEAHRLGDADLLAYLHGCISARPQPIRPPETPAFLDALLASDPLTGGVRPRLGRHHLRTVGVRAHPSRTLPGLLDELGALPFPLRWVTRWIALDRADAEREILRLRRQWFSKRKGIAALLKEAVTREEAALIDTDALSKADECDGALGALGSDAAAFGHLTLTVTVTADTEQGADERARAVEAALNAQGFVARVEDLNAVEAWLGSLPGEPYADVRRPLVSTLNLADILPVCAAWAGPARDDHLAGPPLFLARTTGATPFRVALHVGDVGHAMVVGPTGSGKSALLAFMALQWLRYPRARIVAFDKGRSMRAATLACGGVWRALSASGGFELQPLALIDDPAERAWSLDWLCEAAALAGLVITPRRREEAWSALSALAGSPPAQRTLTLFCALVQDRDMAAALEPLTVKGAHGALLDAAGGAEPSGVFETFELEQLMSTPSVVPTVLGALFHDLERGFDGAPTLMILDEAWLFLGESGFAARIREWLKTLRKKNVAVVFATQSLDDVVRSPIASALIESCPTQVLLPNPRALEPASADLYRLFGLNRRQLELLAFAPPKRAYYLRQPAGRRLFDLRLSGAGLAICGASTPEDQTLIDRILDACPSGGFAPAFLEAKGVAAAADLFAAFQTPTSLAAE